MSIIFSELITLKHILVSRNKLIRKAVINTERGNPKKLLLSNLFTKNLNTLGYFLAKTKTYLFLRIFSFKPIMYVKTRFFTLKFITITNSHNLCFIIICTNIPKSVALNGFLNLHCIQKVGSVYK